MNELVDPPAVLPADVTRVQDIGQVTQILQLCCRVTGMGFSAVARVTEETWMTCAALDLIGFGLKPGDELPLKTTICDEIRDTGQMVVFDDAADHDHFRTHHTPRIYGLRSYISIPIRTPDGVFFGTLCAIDSQPKTVNTPEITGMFQMFADLIGAQLAAQDASVKTLDDLARERETARLREEFIAVVGHDLRNPLASVMSGLNLLQRRPDKTEVIIREMSSAARRMNSMILNLLDFAHGRLGGGIEAWREQGVVFDTLLSAILTEVRALSDREIIVTSSVTRAVDCDPQRLGQVLSNLLGNAVTHGTPGLPVTIDATATADRLEISVSNFGQTIPPEVLARLFKPFERHTTTVEGLGLGLYISAEIAKAHDGTLSATSAEGRIILTLSIRA